MIPHSNEEISPQSTAGARRIVAEFISKTTLFVIPAKAGIHLSVSPLGKGGIEEGSGFLVKPGMTTNETGHLTYGFLMFSGTSVPSAVKRGSY